MIRRISVRSLPRAIPTAISIRPRHTGITASLFSHLPYTELHTKCKLQVLLKLYSIDTHVGKHKGKQLTFSFSWVNHGRIFPAQKRKRKKEKKEKKLTKCERSLHAITFSVNVRGTKRRSSSGCSWRKMEEHWKTKKSENRKCKGDLWHKLVVQIWMR